MPRQAPEYPGYKAADCNGCGLCCLTVPCAISVQFGLWRVGKGCRALSFEAGRYWCDAMRNPRRVSVKLARLTAAVRADCLGAGSGCDHRAAYSLEEAIALLATRNLADELAGITGDTFPRMCMLHLAGKVYGVFKGARDDEPRIIELPDDPRAAFDPRSMTPVSEWSPP